MLANHKERRGLKEGANRLGRKKIKKLARKEGLLII